MQITDEEMISHALNYWANHIETGDMVLSAKDASNMKKPYKALEIDQMKFVIRLREKAAAVLVLESKKRIAK